MTLIWFALGKAVNHEPTQVSFLSFTSRLCSYTDFQNPQTLSAISLWAICTWGLIRIRLIPESKGFFLPVRGGARPSGSGAALKEAIQRATAPLMVCRNIVHPSNWESADFTKIMSPVMGCFPPIPVILGSNISSPNN